MQFIKPDVNIDFNGKRKIAFSISGLMILISIASLIYHGGPKYGIDFAGGTLIQVKFAAPVNIAHIKDGLKSVGVKNVSVQLFGSAQNHEFLIRTDRSATSDETFADKVQQALSRSTGKTATVRRVEMVGPKVGKDLKEKALFAIFYSLLFITIYISGRFEYKWVLSGVMAGALMGAVYILSLFTASIAVLIVAALIVTLILFWFLRLKYAMGAIVALIHDVTITVGIFSLLNKDFTLDIIAALLTIIGYSLNDTIIVFDRIRENLRKSHKSSFDTIINMSINQTLSRTVLTSGTTLLAVVSLFVLGGGIIHDFALAMIVGIVVGTYSSIYVASPILLIWQPKGKKKRV